MRSRQWLNPRNSVIPKSWVKLAGWNDRADDYSDPPAEFWRTLVADRGRGNGKPPYNYATACKESMKACMRQLESRCFLRLRYDRILAKAESRHQRDMYQQEIREEQVAINGQIEEWRKRYEDDFIRRKRKMRISGSGRSKPNIDARFEISF